MIIVGAMAANRVIGKGEGMPWDIPEEYRHFQQLIAGETIIIGRRSYNIFRDTLTSARNIVVSRSVTDIPGAIVAASVEDAMREAASFGPTYFSAGGATIYEQTIPLADTMYLSHIKATFPGDTYFPPFDESEWRIDRRDDHPQFEFIVYKRIR